MNELARAASATPASSMVATDVRPPRVATRVERRGGGQGAEEGRGRQQRRAEAGEPLWQAVAEHDRQRRAETRARRHPGKSGIGERIAEEALHERA